MNTIDFHKISSKAAQSLNVSPGEFKKALNKTLSMNPGVAQVIQDQEQVNLDDSKLIQSSMPTNMMAQSARNPVDEPTGMA